MSIAKPKSSSKLETLVGLVGPGTPGGVRSGDGPWRVVFELVAWRTMDAEISRDAIRVEQQVSERELDNRAKRVKALSIVRLLGRFKRRKVGDLRTFIAASLEKGGRDRELQAIAKELRRPIRLEDPDLGTLTLNRAYDWFEGKVDWQGDSVALYLQATSLDVARSIAMKAKRVVRGAKRWDGLVRRGVCERLHKVCERWAEQGEVSAPSRTQFMRRLKIESITCGPMGVVEFMLDDGGLFHGHGIDVSVDKGGRVTRASLFG